MNDIHVNKKGFVNIMIIILMAVIAGAIGYFTLVKKQTPPPATPQNVTQKNADDCNLIGNSSFRSIDKHEVGLGVGINVLAMGYWDIQFQKGTTSSDYGEPTFQWHHSDIFESGTYTCNDNVLQVKFLNRSIDRSITAHYDGPKEILTWDSFEYKRVK